MILNNEKDDFLLVDRLGLFGLDFFLFLLMIGL